MSKREVFAPDKSGSALFAALTAEAWLDPDLAAELAKDKAATISRFAREQGYPVPEGDAIEAFVLPENPIGDLTLEVPKVTMEVTAQDDPTCTWGGCNTAATGCGSTNGCPSPTYVCQTQTGCTTDCTYPGCYSTDCTYNMTCSSEACSTSRCTMDWACNG